MLRKFLFIILSVVCIIIHNKAISQVSIWQETRRGSIYLGYGLNVSGDPSSTIHIEQADLNSSYDLLKVKNQKYANSKFLSLFSVSYNVGYFFNYNQTWAFEVCYTPVSFNATDKQTVKLKGIKNSINVDTTFVFADVEGNHYYLKSGTGLVSFNLVRRYPLYRNRIRNMSADAYGKIGLGPILLSPDVQIDGYKNDPAFSTSGGLTTDIALGARGTLEHYLYCELLFKYNKSYFNNVNIYKGYATQDLSNFVVNINVGIFFPTTRHNPMFRKGEKRRKDLPNGPEPRGDLNQKLPNGNQVIENY